ncbi:GIY-YIG nuclease family protein [Lysinibacillus fusiformis]|uniref:GIY-YIG nuclease family protein n=1 Tax=Lysinibacillus fusiformis TaxID=28031 RepID=UPI001E614747|nr:GIY-YIG nuclease family protein [Lysinibacillus fusiformis]MCE4045581.1 GIY-YIG nuclease family protein [Lysinibacillus fusiformis]
MGIFSKLFKSKKNNEEVGEQKKFEDVNANQKPVSENTNSNKLEYTGGLGFSIELNNEGDVNLTPLPVGVSTGSNAKDFYVYEWFIKETGEIFYVGKGRGNRFKEFHQRAYEAEKIRKMYETDSHFVATELTEDEAIEIESKEISRILNETNDRLTNRHIPLFTKRGNGYDRSPSTPKIQFETAPVLYACEIEEHYFGKLHRAFDEVHYENLKAVAFITRSMRDEISIIYGGNLEKYKDEVTNTLLANGNKVLKSKFAKSVTAWIYIGDDYVINYDIDQEKALIELGGQIPTYHLIDVWKLLKNKFGEFASVTKEEPVINAIHNRVPLKDIKNLNNWEKGFDKGYPYYEEGDKERKSGNILGAIELFDKARFNGYNAPALYSSYAMAYRKLKDYDNEIAILNEAIERLKSEHGNNETRIMEFNERRAKALALKCK